MILVSGGLSAGSECVVQVTSAIEASRNECFGWITAPNDVCSDVNFCVDIGQRVTPTFPYIPGGLFSPMTNPKVPYRVLSLAIIFAVISGVSGCGGMGSEKVVPVTGRVMVDGMPMSQGTVTFMPDESKGNKTQLTPGGMIDGSGNYKLMTGDREGAPPGWYRVGVSPMGMSMGGGMPTQSDPTKLEKSGPNKKYQLPSTSGISIEVVESPAAGAYDLKLTK